MESLVIMFGDIFKGKTVLITGHTGFKGSWLSVWLKKLGANVVGYSLDSPTEPSLFKLAGLDKKIYSNIGDIRDLQNLIKVMKDFSPDIIFHLAAQSLVRPSFLEPVETFTTNVIGTVNVLEAAKNIPSVRVCQIITSDKCYENKEWVYAYRENDRMGGFDPYSASKGCAELVVSSYRRSFFSGKTTNQNGISLSSVRAGNVIGGGDWSEYRIIPDCVRALVHNIPIELRKPKAIRPWQFVLDPLSGYLRLAALQWDNPKDYTGGWNFGPGDYKNFCVSDLVEQIIHYWGSGSWVNGGKNLANHHHEAAFLKLDCTKAKNLLNWQPVYSIQEAINETTRWYRKWTSDTSFDAYKETLLQIATYEKAAQSRGAIWVP